MIDANINEKENINWSKYLTRIITFIIMLVIIIFVIQALKLGLFDSKRLLIDYIEQYGIWAPLIFIILQIFQVIIPIIPGGASCLAGVLAFGPLKGFIYNYIGLVIGSVIVYHLAKRYGLNLIRKIFKENTINKYLTWFNTKNYLKLFFIAIILPGFPDDLLCYIAGISNIRFKNFLLIILIGKPISLLTYSLFINII